MTEYTEDEIRLHRELTLRELRRTGPQRFDMGIHLETDWHDGSGPLVAIDVAKARCGTAACFAGHAAIVWATLDEEGYASAVANDNWATAERTIAAWLGLNTSLMAPDMFHYNWWPTAMRASAMSLRERGLSRARAEWVTVVDWLAWMTDPENVMKPAWMEAE